MPGIMVPEDFHHHPRLPEQMLYRYNLSLTGSSNKFIRWHKALAGVHIRAGLLTISGERVVSGLVQRLGSLDFVNDNTGCFSNGGKFPKNGKHHRVRQPPRLLRHRLERQHFAVPVAPDSAKIRRSGHATGSVEVMVVGTAGTGKEAAAEGAGQTRSTRTAKPPTERDQRKAGAYRNPLEIRLEKDTAARDARHRLDRVYLSEMIEAEGPPGPKCFGPRIMKEEPPVRNFQLPRDTKTYDGTTKPEDWLADYVTAVYVAGGGGTRSGGNRRSAVRIVPSFLVGPARIWLNNLPAGSINGWIDFEEAFVSNFSSTYRRPNRPQQLALCVQRSNETDRDYLTRWNSTRNSCEGVIEAQAIAWFCNGCRRGSPLWQKLQRNLRPSSSGKQPAILPETLPESSSAHSAPTQAIPWHPSVHHDDAGATAAQALGRSSYSAGLLTISGERVVSGLVQRLGSLDFVNDNTGCFSNGGKFPKNGSIIEFGSLRVYYGTVPERQCLSPVAPDPPRSVLRSGHAAGSVEVMVVGTAGTGKEAAAEGAGQTRSTRTAKPPTERDQEVAGTSAAPPETPLQAAMNVLATPIAQNIDPAAAQAELEAQRQKLLSGGADIIRAQRELNLTLREYNAAHGFASVSAQPARIPENRLRARNLDQDLRKDILTGKSASASLSIVDKPKYSSPDKTIKAARAAVEMCDSLTGDALAKQQDRVRELLDIIQEQHAEQLAKMNKAAASKIGAFGKECRKQVHGQASSPIRTRREKDMNAQQMIVYDPDGKQQAGNTRPEEKPRGRRGYAGNGYAGNNYAGKGEAGQNYRAARAAYDEEEMSPPHARAACIGTLHEADSKASSWNPLGIRLGERCLPDRDARHRLDRVYLSEMIEAEGPPGPKCFGPRIMKEEPPVRNFSCPGTQKHTMAPLSRKIGLRIM
ncbi:hypothetical protein QYE76_058713 [Lolium multiflorum]|uniref:Retrotransposon gag domain-containing protein n=1 Tax=Lolium multiflorum TaxID=4521 RepID=A0AAD8WPX7_LOLMU|nr:hypothetical protein QYE76_058713 [Lolium multiflorum]